MARSSDLFTFCPNKFTDVQFSIITGSSNHQTISHNCANILHIVLLFDPKRCHLGILHKAVMYIVNAVA